MTQAGWLVLGQVLMIDLVLAGDNAVVVGLAASLLPVAERRRAIAAGIGAATVIRVGLALVALRLLAVVGLVFAGGVLLLWVCWRMWRELRVPPPVAAPAPVGSAVLRIVVADLSMSLDNVLAVAGAARGHPRLLVAGLLMSVVLMGVAAHALAALLARQRWIAWAGLAVVAYVAIRMIWQGGRVFFF